MVDRNRVTSMRDPAAPSGAIDILDVEAKLPRAKTGSRYFSGNIDGKWYVLNGHREPALKTPFDTEKEALDRAAEKNGIPNEEKPEVETDR